MKTTWNKLKTPPPTALKKITGGRLSGMTDINPQWRYEVMTEVFGVCGVGWKYSIDKLWTEQATEGQIFAFAQVSVYVRMQSPQVTEYDSNNKLISPPWSEPIPGIGGSMLIEKQSKTDWNTKEKKETLYCNDEAYKMAVTDALSVALKMLGVASDIYQGKWDGSKYKPEIKDEPKATSSEIKPKMEDVPPELGANAEFEALPLGDKAAELIKLCEKKKYTPKKPVETMRPEEMTKFYAYLNKLEVK